MSQHEPTIANISETARWVAVYRAQESERPDALFHDPYARRLAGERGQQIASQLAPGNREAWAFVVRTYLIDRLLRRAIEQGADTVINLAAGLDARPYRMQLPSKLRWFEVDLPALLEYKESILHDATPNCALERIPLDLAQREARQALFARIGADAQRAVVISEGLLIYLDPTHVGELATDLLTQSSFHNWIIDIASPGLIQMVSRQWGQNFHQPAPFKFGPEEGPGFFRAFGWAPEVVESSFKTAARLKRVRLSWRILALLPESKGRQGKRPWSGIVLLGRS